ncbi:hypothetical protein PYW08_011089 [Mythimna loreyi]|uniref:Uncharacterized protein n=1 Tax=Mythimna loreyi TaxID=667449 RepID=A0ACC2Q2L5_9NEOP|nr:hypothetical protein PYW08_011089 [Mythimna loreyi]
MLRIAILFVVGAIFSTALAEIVRPCSFRNYRCIADNLRANSRCNRNVKGFLPPKYEVPEFRFETAYFNSSYVDRNLIVKNHHKCFVSEFFLNPETNTAVLTIDCPNLELESDRVLIQHRSKREDSFFFYRFHAVYPLIRITVNLRGHMDLCRAHVYTEVCQLPHFNIKPQDKRTQNFLSRDLTPLMIFEREQFYYAGDRLAKVFIDYFICDYGCNRRILPHYNESITNEI